MYIEVPVLVAQTVCFVDRVVRVLHDIADIPVQLRDHRIPDLFLLQSYVVHRWCVLELETQLRW